MHDRNTRTTVMCRRKAPSISLSKLPRISLRPTLGYLPTDFIDILIEIQFDSLTRLQLVHHLSFVGIVRWHDLNFPLKMHPKSVYRGSTRWILIISILWKILEQTLQEESIDREIADQNMERGEEIADYRL